jgi:hypothetical protein
MSVQDISGSGNIKINSGTPASNVSTGALVVSGGVGISGNTYVGGNVIVSGNIYMNGVLVGTGTGSANFGTNPLTAGNLTVGTITASSLNLTTGGIITAGTIVTGSNLTLGSVSTTSIYIPSASQSNNVTSGALVVSGGVGISGNTYVGGNVTVSGGAGITGNLYVGGNISSGSVSALQFIETITSLSYAASITVGYLSGTLISIPSVTSSITGLAITNIPTNVNRSYSMVFVLATTVSSGYISTGSININGSAVTLRGTINASVPSAYIIQQISMLNISGTFAAFTRASFF